MTTVSGNDFARLTQEEQRAVAERLLRIEESGWKPFWCPDSGCDGMPHRLLKNEDGDVWYVSTKKDKGPQGQPLGEIEYVDDEAAIKIPLGRPVLDPQWAHNHARQDQRLPAWSKPWTLFIMSGRGTGKTRTGVEFVTLNARKGLDGAIVGRRGTELENTHVATLIEKAHPEFKPTYLASKDLLKWPNGAVTYLFSAERPENIRSVNLSYCWFDEAAFMDEIKTAWMNAKMATRVKSKGNPIHILVTSTPTSTPWVMDMEDDPDVEVRRVSTYANKANLDPGFLADLEKEYEGTRIGRQELHGEVLRDVEGSLWNDDLFKHLRFKDASEFHEFLETLDDVVVAVDPAGSANKRSDLTGIIAVGAQHFDDDGNPLDASRFYVLADGTLKGSPSEWGAQVYRTARLVKASRIIAEKNFGGDMVKQVLVDYGRLNPSKVRDVNGDEIPIKVAHATQNKETRAEGTVNKYEQARVTHVLHPIQHGDIPVGDMSRLEKEQVHWVPKSRGGRQPSPNRIDALVWAVLALESKIRFTTQQATSNSVRAMLKRNNQRRL